MRGSKNEVVASHILKGGQSLLVYMLRSLRVMPKVSLMLYFGSIMRLCRKMLSQKNNILVKFVRRQANRVAHTLTKASHSCASSTIFDVAPDLILHLINEA